MSYNLPKNSFLSGSILLISHFPKTYKLTILKHILRDIVIISMKVKSF